jgi:23S rRNA-/tRNA-specific pseudouridylate synthase
MHPFTSDTPALIEKRGRLYVFYKPSGWNTHSAGGDETGSENLVEWARNSYPGEGPLSPVNRLDLETSGIVLMSADPTILKEMGRHFEKREVKKSYLALIHGRCRKHGTIKIPLRNRGGRMEESSVTRYRLREWIGPYSLVLVKPEQGRRHQIRRHMKGIGHPIVGDERYGRGLKKRVPCTPQRMWLHAWRLELPDGTLFESPLPSELTELLECLRSRYGGSPSTADE